MMMTYDSFSVKTGIANFTHIVTDAQLKLGLKKLSNSNTTLFGLFLK